MVLQERRWPDGWFRAWSGSGLVSRFDRTEIRIDDVTRSVFVEFDND